MSHFTENKHKLAATTQNWGALLSLNDFSGGLNNTSVKGRTPLSANVSHALAAVVSRSSLKQGVKGLLTAGVLKSASYSLAKVTQAIAGRKKRREESS